MRWYIVYLSRQGANDNIRSLGCYLDFGSRLDLEDCVDAMGLIPIGIKPPDFVTVIGQLHNGYSSSPLVVKPCDTTGEKPVSVQLLIRQWAQAMYLCFSQS